MKLSDLWEQLWIRLLAYAFFGLLFFGAWKIVNAQSTTICRAVGQEIICNTVSPPPQPQSGFDPSVIGSIGDTQLSPETLRLLRLKACIKRLSRQGLTGEQVRDICLNGG